MIDSFPLFQTPYNSDNDLGQQVSPHTEVISRQKPVQGLVLNSVSSFGRK